MMEISENTVNSVAALQSYRDLANCDIRIYYFLGQNDERKIEFGATDHTHWQEAKGYPRIHSRQGRMDGRWEYYHCCHGPYLGC